MSKIEIEKKETEQIFDQIINTGYHALNALEAIAPHAFSFSKEMLQTLINENKDTVYGQKYAFHNINSYEDYKKALPLTIYADYEDLVKRISENGEKNVLTSRPVVHFCPTTGTTNTPKLIPLVKESIQLSTEYAMPAFFAMVDRALKEKGKTGFEKGKGIFLLEIGALSAAKSGIPIGGISSTSVRANNELLESIVTSPREVITPDSYLDSKYIQLLFALKERELTWIGSCYMTSVAGLMDSLETNWENLCADIEAGTIHQDIEMSEAVRKSLTAKLTPDPKRADELRKLFRSGFDRPILPYIWPKLSCIGAIGSGSFQIHAEKVSRFAGQNILFCNLLISASETIVAVADGCNSDEFILTPQAAFFEFIPENATDLSDIKTIEDLTIGARYELVVTTLSGLYRYRLFDVIEVTGFYGQIPKVKFSHRANVFLNIAGEKTTEADILRAIGYFTDKTGISISEYSAFADTSVAPGCYCMLLEPDEEIDKNKIDEYAKILEEGFCLTFGYQYERAAGNILPLKLLIQQKQTHTFYRELQIMKGTSPNQLKPLHVLNTPDRKAFFLKMSE